MFVLLFGAPPALAAEPVRIEESDCALAAVPVPARTTCGELVVPEDRASPGGRMLRIPFTRVAPEQPQPGASPLVFMSGGPGSGTTQLTRFLAGTDLARGREVVLLEQRGGKRTSPSLDCPEVRAAYVATLTTADTPEQEGERIGAAMRNCVDRVRTFGGNPAAYTTAATAQDVVDLRRALGHPRWILYGLSWSTRVMGRAAALDQEGTAAVVLDSLQVPGDDVMATSVHGLRRTLRRLSEQAGADYPDLEQDLRRAISRLNAQPAVFPVTNPLDGTPLELRVTGADLVSAVDEALYEVEALPMAPYLLRRLAVGDDAGLRALVTAGLGAIGSHHLPQYYATVCQEDLPFAAPNTDLLLRSSLRVDAVVCARSGLAPAPAQSRAPLAFSAPVLVLAGDEDPATPPDLADQATAGLSRRTYLDFAGVGHAVLLSSRCGREVLAVWVADQAADVTARCDRLRRAYPIESVSSVYPTAAPYLLGDAVDRGRWLALLVPALWLSGSVCWLLGCLIAAVRAALRRRRPWSILLLGLVPASGVAFFGTATLSGLSTMDRQPLLLAFGVPSWSLWLVLLPVAGWVLLGWRALRARGVAQTWLGTALLGWTVALGWLALTMG